MLSEVTAAVSIDEARWLVQECNKSSAVYMLAENYIWHGWCEALLSAVEEGKFGEIVYAEGDYTHDCRDMMLVTENGCVPY